MKRSIFSILFLLSVLFCITGCEEVVDIDFVNNTNFTLVCDFDLREPSDTLLHEDTPWPNGIEKTDCVIKPHSTHVSRFNKRSFTRLEETGLCRSFYFYNIDTIKNVSWEKIRTENIVIKKVHIYSFNDLMYNYDMVICIP